MEARICLSVLLCVLSFVSCEVEWWQKSVVYQIYPRSFKDTNGDGIGDLNGITESLNYVKDLGAETIWLSPIFKSPMYDFGYDIANFKEIQPEYGTMKDFDNLLKNATQLGINLVLDFVPNHGSNESDWFNLSANRTKGYEDYFVWADGKADPNNPGKTLPPSNWRSVFRKSAWEYNSIRKQYYLHQFSIAQPDLNYRNPLIVNEMKDVLRFWLNKGVAGFRVDAIPHLFEVNPKDYGNQYPDEPRANIVNVNEDDYDYLEHIYTRNNELTYDMVYQWKDVLDEYKKKDGKTRMLLTEAYEDIKLTMKYFGNATHEGSVPFNFFFLKKINKESDARDIKYVIDEWMTYMPIGKTANWVNGNHDNNRMATRQGVNRVDIMNMLALILPGIALTYQGEELGMTDGEISWEDTKDPQACNTDDPINYYKVSRDPARTPFQWDDSKNAGFSTATKTWLPVAKNYKVLNVKLEKSQLRSHHQFYKEIVSLRKTRTMSEGEFETKVLSDNVLAVVRFLPNESAIVGIINLGKTIEHVSLSELHMLPQVMTVYTSSINAKLEKGDIVKISHVKLSPDDAIVLVSF